MYVKFNTFNTICVLININKLNVSFWYPNLSESFNYLNFKHQLKCAITARKKLYISNRSFELNLFM